MCSSDFVVQVTRKGEFDLFLVPVCSWVKSCWLDNTKSFWKSKQQESEVLDW